MQKTICRLLVGAVLISLSCKKETPVSKIPGNSRTSATSYPTVDEKQLQGAVRTRLDSPNPTPAQLARRTRNNQLIRKMGLPVLETLPVVEDENLAKLRSPQEAATRCLATTLCAIKGETQDQKLVDSLIDGYSAASYFSPQERQFISEASPSKQNLIDFAWRYECVHVFLWALQERDALSKPNEICPVSDDMAAIKKAGPEKFVAKAKLRPLPEILDMADFYYRLHWSAIELRLKGQSSPTIDEGIIRERHRALNWLIRYFNQEWDDVATDT